MTPTDRLSGFGTGLATNSDSGERVPRGHHPQYSTPNGSARASFFRSLATQEPSGGDRDIPVDVVTSPAGVACWHSAAAFRRPRQEFLRTPHTDQLRRMVAIADRSPARYIFELKLAEVPSGPLNSKLMMFARDQSCIEGDRAGGGLGFLRLPSWLSEESIGPGALALPDHADGRGLVNGT